MIDLIRKWRTQSEDHRTFSIACPAFVFQLYLFAFMTTQCMNWFLGATLTAMLFTITAALSTTLLSIIEITENGAWGMPKEKFK